MAWSTPEQAGRDLFVRRCSGCHAVELNKEGPALRGVYGRKPGSATGFAYSDSLKKVDAHWDDATLDRWLADPEALAPETDMAFRVADAADRKAIIAYLKTLK